MLKQVVLSLSTFTFTLRTLRTPLFRNIPIRLKMSSSSILKPKQESLQVAKKLAEKNHKNFDITYEGYLANHLPHALYTLYALGASPDRIQEFFDEYVKRLQPLRHTEFTVTDQNLWTYRDVQRGYAEYLNFFEKESQKEGLKGTLVKHFPQLVLKSFGAALHPMIHMGFAVEFEDLRVFSEGLAYSYIYALNRADEILDAVKQNSAVKDCKVVDLLSEIKGSNIPRTLPEDVGNFHYKTEYVLANYQNVFLQAISKWDLSSESELPKKLNELTEASILGGFATYSSKIDFFLLHGVTGNHAVRFVFPLLPKEEQRRLLRANLLILLATYAVQHCPNLAVEENILKFESTPKSHWKKDFDSTTWEDIISKTISLDEEHVGKLVRSVIYYAETVPESERSKLFTMDFSKKCCFKAVSLLEDIDSFVF